MPEVNTLGDVWDPILQKELKYERIISLFKIPVLYIATLNIRQSKLSNIKQNPLMYYAHRFCVSSTVGMGSFCPMHLRLNWEDDT